MNPFLDMIHERLQSGADLWAKDLRALDPQRLLVSEGSARNIADITWETILINRRISTRLTGGEPDPMNGFPVCPAEYANVESLIELMATSVNDILSAAGTDPNRTIEMKSGPENAFALAEFAAIHMFYHLGQVNYVQTVYGDVTVHW